MKKILALLTALMLLLSLAACGGDDKPSGNEDNPPASGQQQEQNTPDPAPVEDEPDNSGETTDPGSSGSKEKTVADANAYLAERGFDGFAFPEDLTVAVLTMVDSPAAIAGSVTAVFCPVEKERYEEILQTLFSGTGMTAETNAGETAASLDDCLSMFSNDNKIEHKIYFKEPDWDYNVTVTYYPNGQDGKYEAQTLYINIQSGMKK